MLNGDVEESATSHHHHQHILEVAKKTHREMQTMMDVLKKMKTKYAALKKAYVAVKARAEQCDAMSDELRECRARARGMQQTIEEQALTIEAQAEHTAQLIKGLSERERENRHLETTKEANIDRIQRVVIEKRALEEERATLQHRVETVFERQYRLFRGALLRERCFVTSCILHDLSPVARGSTTRGAAVQGNAVCIEGEVFSFDSIFTVKPNKEQGFWSDSGADMFVRLAFERRRACILNHGTVRLVE
jgi:hypothetical protein